MTRLLLLLFACGLACFTLTLSAAEEAPGKIPKETCVKPCIDCAAECAAGVKHARQNKSDAAMIASMEVCHHACLTCAHAVGSKNARAWAICELCEKICLDCAAMCEKSNDEHMKKCAKACHDCAKACADARK